MAKIHEVTLDAAFGRLTVVSGLTVVRLASRTELYVNCTCSCGSGVKQYRTSDLGRKAKSCGCLKASDKISPKPISEVRAPRRNSRVFVVHDSCGAMTLADAIRISGVSPGTAKKRRAKGKPLTTVLNQSGWHYATKFLTKGTSK